MIVYSLHTPQDAHQFKVLKLTELLTAREILSVFNAESILVPLLYAILPIKILSVGI
jgi:hypothetical protein